jgi:hypothetical protein
VSTISVTTGAELNAALKTAKSGDVISLAPGNYGNVRVKNLAFAGEVVVQSADPSQKAVLTGLNVTDSSGLTFRGLEFSVGGQAIYPIRFTGVDRVIVDQAWVHGTLNGDPGDDTAALLVRESRHFAVTNSEFEQLWHGISFLDGEHYTFSGNTFRELRTDGIRGGGASHVTITNNFFTDFFPAPGDHPDAIQFWTTATTASAHDIVVSGNVILRGDGAPIQGIFFRDQLLKYPYQNVVISDNLIVGAMFNGLMLEEGENITITGNTVLSTPDQKSYVRVTPNAILSDNETGLYIVGGKNVGKFDATKVVTDGGAAALQSWWAEIGSSLTGLPPALLAAAGVSPIVSPQPPSIAFEPPVPPAPAPPSDPAPAGNATATPETQIEVALCFTPRVGLEGASFHAAQSALALRWESAPLFGEAPPSNLPSLVPATSVPKSVEVDAPAPSAKPTPSPAIDVAAEVATPEPLPAPFPAAGVAAEVATLKSALAAPFELDLPVAEIPAFRPAPVYDGVFGPPLEVDRFAILGQSSIEAYLV